MSVSSGVVDVMSVKSMDIPFGEGVSSGRAGFNMRHELVDAQVEVLRMYLEKKSREQLLVALDRLIKCTQASFREEEGLMDLLAPTADPRHRDMHREVLAQMTVLRRDVMDFNRGRLLAQLILVDRQLTSHISDAEGVQGSQQRDSVAERETAGA